MAALAHGTAAAAVSRAAAPVDVGYRSFSFGDSVAAPTAKEPQSKLWFNDGRWWGLLYSASAGEFRIWQLDLATHTWSDTGTTVDIRESAKCDALWDVSRLYTACAGFGTSSGERGTVRRYSYSSSTKKYTLDAGFPVNISTIGAPALSIEKDSQGVLWATYYQSNKVWITHTTTSDTTWVAPFVLPTTGTSTGTSAEETAIVSFNGKIGVMYSNMRDWAFYFAIHRDGDPGNVWQSTVAHQATGQADNHINLVSLEGDPGLQVAAAVKFETGGSTAPLYDLMLLKSDGTWTKHVAWRMADNITRAQVQVDLGNRHVYMFGAAPCCSGGVIYYKRTSLDNPSFATGLGTPLIKSSSDVSINNVTSTKQVLTSASGLLAAAEDDNSNWYLHNHLPISGATGGPDTTITSAPESPTASSTASFSFTSTAAGATFQCSLDGGAFAACTSPTTYSGLVDGSHSFQVRSTSSTGQTDPTPAVHTWTVDSTPAALTTLNPVDDTYAAGDVPATNFGSATTLSVDGTPVRISYLKFDLRPLTGHVVTAAKLRMFVSNPSSDVEVVKNVASTSWSESTLTFDNRPPVGTTVTTFTPGPTTNVYVEVDLRSLIEANVGSLMSFAIDSAQADGYAFNSAEAAANKVELVIESTPPPSGSIPDTTITSGPADPTGSTSATFAFSSDQPGSTFQCKLDTSAFEACTSPKSYSGLAEGTHTFAVMATNAAGADPTPATMTWRIDTTAPETTIVSHPASPSSSTSATFGFTSSAGGSQFQCALDGAPYASCASPVSYSGLANGSHTFQVKATDGVGNTDPTPATFSWTVDTVAPETAVTSGPSDPTTSRSADFVFGSSESSSTFECALDGAAYVLCTSPTSYSGLALGTHTFTVRATDAAGNTDATPASRTWTIEPDTTPPDTTITSGPTDQSNATSASFSFASSEAGSTFECSLDGGAYAACTSPHSYADLAEGSHAFAVRAIDSSGNNDQTPATWTWTIVPGLFVDGFESGDFSRWSLVTTAGDGTAVVQSTLVGTGSFAAELAETSSSGSRAYVRRTLPSEQLDLTVAGTFQILQEGAAGGNVPLLRVFNSAGTRLISLYRQNQDGDKVRVTHSGAGTTTSGTLALNTWARFELHLVIAGTGASTVEVRMNGTTIYTTTTASLGTLGALTIQIGNDTSGQAFRLVADDISTRVGG